MLMGKFALIQTGLGNFALAQILKGTTLVDLLFCFIHFTECGFLNLQILCSKNLLN